MGRRCSLATMSSSPARPSGESSFLSKAGTVALAAVKHVPTRMALWGAIGLMVGLVCVAVSYALGFRALGTGGAVIAYAYVIPIGLVHLGVALFVVHGLHRGAARAALALERKFGLASHFVHRVTAKLGESHGERLQNLPLQQLEARLKQTISGYLASKEDDEGKGMAAYVVRRARTAIVARIETYLLAAYREELAQDGSGGGVSLPKLRDRVASEMSSRLGDIVMSPLNKQLAVLMTVYVLLTTGWWFWLYLIIMAVGMLAGHSGPG